MKRNDNIEAAKVEPMAKPFFLIDNHGDKKEPEVYDVNVFFHGDEIELTFEPAAL